VHLIRCQRSDDLVGSPASMLTCQFFPRTHNVHGFAEVMNAAAVWHPRCRQRPSSSATVLSHTSRRHAMTRRMVVFGTLMTLVLAAATARGQFISHDPGVRVDPPNTPRSA